MRCVAVHTGAVMTSTRAFSGRVVGIRGGRTAEDAITDTKTSFSHCGQGRRHGHEREEHETYHCVETTYLDCNHILSFGLPAFQICFVLACNTLGYWIAFSNAMTFL